MFDGYDGVFVYLSLIPIWWTLCRIADALESIDRHWRNKPATRVVVEEMED